MRALAAPRGRRRRCAPAGPSRPGTRATTASRRSSTASRPRPGAAAFAALPAADGDGRVRPLLELGRDEVRERVAAGGHRLARRLLERRPQLRAQPRAPRSAAGVPLAAPGGRGQPAAHGRAAGRGRRRARRARRRAALRRAAASRTAAVAAAPLAVLRRALRRVAGFPAPRPVAAERVGCARARALGRGLGAARRRPRRRAPLRPHRDRPRRTAVRRRQREVALAVPGRDALRRDRVVHCALAAAEDALDAALAPGARPARSRAPGSACPARAARSRGCCSRRACRAASALATLSSPRTASRWHFRASPWQPPCADPLDSCSHSPPREPFACRSRRRARGRADLGRRAARARRASSASRSRATTRASIRCSWRCSRAP